MAVNSSAMPHYIYEPIIEDARITIFPYESGEIELEELRPIFDEIIEKVSSKKKRTIHDLDGIIKDSVAKMEKRELYDETEGFYQNLIREYLKKAFETMSKAAPMSIDEIRTEPFPVSCLLAWADVYSFSSKILQQVYKELSSTHFWLRIKNAKARSQKEAVKVVEPVKETLLAVFLLMIRVYEMVSLLQSGKSVEGMINEQLLFLSEEMSQLSYIASKGNFIPEMKEPGEEEKIFMEAIRILTT